MKLYTMKSAGGKCPVCGARLAHCHIGEYCSKPKCTYVDGYARLTAKQAKKLGHQILR